MKNKILLFAFVFVFLVLISANGVNALVGEDTHNYTFGGTGSVGANQTAGVRIFTNQSLLLTTVNKTSASDPNIVYLMNDTNHILATASYGSNGVATFNYLIPANFYFKLASTNTSGGWTLAFNDSTSRPLLRSKVVTWANGTFRNETDGQPTYSGTPNYFSVITSIGFDTAPIFANNNSYNASTFQTAREGFSSNYNFTNVSSVSLIYNGVIHSASATELGQTTQLLSSVNIPSSLSGSIVWKWNVTLNNGTNIIPTSFVQSVSAINLSICQAGNTVNFFNITFKNETTNLETVNSSFSLSWNYYLGTGAENKSFSYTNTSYLKEYDFCFTPADRTVNIYGSATYSNVESPVRFYTLEATPFNNISTQQTLYLLPTSLGLYTRYKTITASGSSISDVFASVSRTINSVVVPIASGLTDDSGLIAFWLNPDVSYDYTFSKDGFPSTTLSLTPNSLDTYLITMGSSSGSVNIGTNVTGRNLSVNILPTNLTLINNTVYTFSFNVSSATTINRITMNITNSSGTQIYYQSMSGQGILSSNINTGNNTILRGAYTITIGNETLNFYRTWTVGNFYTGDYSVYNQFTLFMDYGFSDFIRVLIVIFVIVGIMIFLSSSEVIDTMESKLAVLTLLVWAFSIVGWLDTGIVVSSTDAGISSLGQMSNQYGIAIITSIISVSLIVKRLFQF